MRKKLKELREEKKLTQQQLAHCLGLARTGYASIEQGIRNPSLKIALNIKEFFKYKNDDIFTITP